MSKRSSFARIPRDNYPTPREAVAPLIPHLAPFERFAEPCAGDGALVRALEAHGHRCIQASDIEQDARVVQIDARATCCITNPPWTREILHPIIDNLSAQCRTWLLFDADWIQTRQADGLWQRCALIVSVGRLKWIPNSPHRSKDSACWYCFEPNHNSGPQLIGRVNQGKEKG